MKKPKPRLTLSESKLNPTSKTPYKKHSVLKKKRKMLKWESTRQKKTGSTLNQWTKVFKMSSRNLKMRIQPPQQHGWYASLSPCALPFWLFLSISGTKLCMAESMKRFFTRKTSPSWSRKWVISDMIAKFKWTSKKPTTNSLANKMHL